MNLNQPATPQPGICLARAWRAVTLTLALCFGFAVTSVAALPPLVVQGKNLVTPDGQRVLLRGVNLGNWFVIEPWMLGLAEGPDAVRDQYEIEQTFAKRFGVEEKERLMDVYRSHWITDRDFEIIRTFGFNAVRLPLNYRLMEDDANPLQLRPDAWKWVDRAVEMAERHGLYVILDMHGAQGGQSEYDHTGRAGQNKLWTETRNQERLAWLWSHIARRYRDRAAVAAYDVFNEPYGGTKAQQVEVFRRAYAAIRAEDPDKLVYAHGDRDDFAHYGDPKTNRWRNVGFEMHYYPGLFGDAPNALSHVRHFRRAEETAKHVDRLNVPFLVGEMNVVLNAAGGAPMMRRHFDLYTRYGWAVTMWSYRVLSREGGLGGGSWGMVTSKAPARTINFRTASKDEIEAYFRWIGAEEYEVNEPLRRALTEARPKLPPLPTLPAAVSSVKWRDRLPGWTANDLGGARTGGLRRVGTQGFELWGGGEDVWGSRDQCRFLTREVRGDFDLEITVESLADVQRYAKAGLMVRTSTAPDAATFLLAAFPDGETQAGVRLQDAANMEGRDGVKGPFPVRLSLTRRGDTMTARQEVAGDGWREITSANMPGLAETLYVGAFVLSHDNSTLARGAFRGLRLKQGDGTALPRRVNGGTDTPSKPPGENR